MKTRIRPLHIAWLATVLLIPSVTVTAEDEGTHFLKEALAGLTLGEGQSADQVIVFPLLAPVKPDKLGIKPDVWASKVGWSEPEFPKKRYNVGIANNETQPLLVLGGTVLGGGKRDRLVPHDVIVPVGGRVEIRTIVASSNKDKRKDAVPFRIASSTAPPYLRERAEFHPTNTLVPNFVSHFLDFRNEDDKRHSLSAISASEQLNVLCLPCHKELSEFPLLEAGRVVGMVTAIRGRIRSLELFGSNRLFKAYFGHLLKSHTFAAAAIAVRAKKLGFKEPGNGDPEMAVAEMRAKAEKLLDRLQGAKVREGDEATGSVGTYAILRTSNGTRGTAVSLEGKFVHAAIFPHDPFEHALFSRNLKPLPEEELYGTPGLEHLGNRARHGRLSPYERRLIGRLRGRRR